MAKIKNQGENILILSCSGEKKKWLNLIKEFSPCSRFFETQDWSTAILTLKVRKEEEHMSRVANPVDSTTMEEDSSSEVLIR